MPRGLRYDVKPKAVGLVGDAVQPSNQVRLHKAINRKLTDAAAKAGGCGVLDVVCVELTHMNGVNLATALHRLARDFANNEAGLPGGAQALSEVTSHAAFPALLEAVRQRAMEVVAEREAGKQSDGDSGMPAQCASIVAWSLAWLNLKERALLQTLAELATPHLDGFKPYEVTNMLWAYAKLNEWNAPLFRAVAERLRARAKWEFKVQCLSVASWSFTTVKWRDEELFRSLAEEMSGQATLLKPQEISNTLWAYGKQKIAHEELFKALGWSAFELVWQCRFKPQELATSLEAFARVGISHPNLFANAVNVVIRRAQDFSPGQVASILGAYSESECANGSELAAKLLSVVACRTDSYQPQELVSVAQSALKLCPNHSQFFEACANCARLKLESFESRLLSELREVFGAVEVSQVMPSYVIQLMAQVRKEAEVCLAASTLMDRCSTDSTIRAPTQDGLEEDSDSGTWYDAVDRLAGNAEQVAGTAIQEDAWKVNLTTPPGLDCAPLFLREISAANQAWAPAKMSAGLHDAPKPPVLPASCLTEEEEPLGLEIPVESGSLYMKAAGSKCRPQPLRLRHGMFDVRVVLRALECGASWKPFLECPNVLQPVAVIADSPLEGMDSRRYLAYPHCRFGNLMEYVTSQKARNLRSISQQRSALIAIDVIRGVEAMLQSGGVSPAQIVGSIMPIKIFIDAAESALVLAPVNTGKPQTWRKMAMTMKWMSPEEVQDVPVEHSNVWDVTSYRVGLLLYCLGLKDTGGDMVPIFIQDSQHPNQVDMSQYQQSGLRTIVEQCLRLGQSQHVPARDTLLSALEAAACSRPGKVFGQWQLPQL